MSDTTSGAITFTGLGSGTDFASMITKLVEVESYRINQLTSWKSEWNEKSNDFSALNTKLLSLQSTLKSMDTMSSFIVKTASSSDESVIKATASSAAMVTTHNVQVKQLATNSILTNNYGVSDTAASINTSGSTEYFSYTYNGKTVSCAVPAGYTLTNLMNLINGSTENPGVKASIINDGSAYHLQIRGMDLGSAYTVKINSTTTLSNFGFGTGQFAVSQVASNALIKVDGFPTSADKWISRASNSISDVIDGLTLNLKSTPTSSLTNYTITVGTDTDSIKQNIQNFVTGVNTIRQAIQDLTKFDSSTQTGSILTGNYGLQIISSRLQDITASSAVGFNYDKDVYTSLSQIGISTDATQGSSTEGMLVIDDDALDAALASNPDAVAQLFACQGTGVSDSDNFVFTSSLYSVGITKAGTYNVQYTVAGGKITAATINGHAATFTSNGTTITGAQGHDEAGLALNVTNLHDGTYSGNVRIKEGKNIEMVDDLTNETDTTNGPLAILQSNYKDIMDSIDNSITYEQNRISRYESDMKSRFANLDALLGTYNNISTSLTSQIASLKSSS